MADPMKLETPKTQEKQEKNKENLINTFNRKISFTNNNLININRLSVVKDEDSDIEGMKKFIDLVGDMNENKFSSFSKDKKIQKSKSISNIKKSNFQMVEMKLFEEEKEKDKEKDKEKEKEDEKEDEKEKEKEKEDEKVKVKEGEKDKVKVKEKED